MGYFSEYLDRQFDFLSMQAERKAQLGRISSLRGGRDILVYAADIAQNDAPITLDYTDLLPFDDQLSNLSGTALDLILETPGGSGEIAEHIVKAMRSKYDDVAVIVPGSAMSAGTIISMAANDILMAPSSSLGPIDAQLFVQGKVFSVDAFIEGFEKIKDEVRTTGELNKAYIPMLQGISPGELQAAENQKRFARELVTSWLESYKFGAWNVHSSDGRPVTQQEKHLRANEIADELSKHSRWMTHGRFVKIDDLTQLRLRITDYSKDASLADAIQRYYTLLRMTLEGPIYKVFETPHTQVYRFSVPMPAPPNQPSPDEIGTVNVDLVCEKCGSHHHLQANLKPAIDLSEGSIPFPNDNQFECPNCQTHSNLIETRRQIEGQFGRPIIPW